MKINSEKITSKFTFSKEERLCSKKLFDRLFAEGKTLRFYPLKILYLETGHSGKYPVKAAFTVSKKNYRKAVVRNLLKRRMREAYRLNKHHLYKYTGEKKLILIFIYTGNEILDFHQIESSIKRLITFISKKIFIPNP